jgi:hypothetical protein
VRVDGRVAVTTLAGVYGVVCAVLSPPGPFTAPDSVAYVTMDPIVPVGYPLFLSLIGADAAMRIQPLIFAGALGFLGVEVLALTGSVAIAVLMQLGIIAIPGLRDTHATILTESLFMSGLVALLAAAFSYVRVPSWKRAAGAAAIVALTASIRRTGYALVPVLVLMLLSRRQAQRRVSSASALAVIVPLATGLAADAIATTVVHGDRATSLVGRHIFAKAALLDADAALGDGSQSVLRHALRDVYAPVREFIATAPALARPTLTLYYETCLQGPCVSALRDALGSDSDARRNERFAAAGWERVRMAPLAFLQLVLTHYTLMWTPYHWRHPDVAEALTSFLAAHRPVPFEREAFKVAPEEPLSFAPARGVRALQPLVAAIGWLTAGVALFGVAIAVFSPAPNPGLMAAALAAVSAHSCLLFSAVAAAGLARFTIGVLPAIVASLGMTLWVVSTAFAPRVASPSAARYH